MSYQRFAFENLSPERQREIVEKQVKQQQQKEMLRKQIEEQQKMKAMAKDEKRRRKHPESSYSEPEQSHFDRAAAYPREAIPMPAPPASDYAAYHPAPVQMSPVRPLLVERRRLPAGGRHMSMGINPAKIHDTFSALRGNIVSMSQRTVLT